MNAFTHLFLHEHRSAELAADVARARLARVTCRRRRRVGDEAAAR